MKDFNEITSHVLAIDKADDEKAISFYERKKNLEALVCKVADELIAGRPVPVFNQAESITRIDGLLTQLANELVRQHDMAIAHRTHLAERLEADGGENGAKAAAILRGMNPVADSKAALLRARGDTFASIPMTTVQGQASAVAVADALEALAPEFAGLQRAVHEAARDIGHDLARSVGEHIAAAPKRLKGRAWVEDAKRRRNAGVPLGDIIRQAGHDADLEAAELRGFYQGRNQAWRLLMENQKRHPDTIKVSRAFLGDFQRDLLHMQKES